MIDPLRLEKLLETPLSKHRGLVAIIDSKKSWTYGDLDNESDNICTGLVRAALGHNEPVIVVTSHLGLNVAAFIGVWKARGVVVPIYYKASINTCKSILETTGSRLIIGENELLPAAFRGLDRGIRSRGDVVWEIVDSTRSAEPLLEEAAFVVYSSGTTGRPKGIVQLHQIYCRKLAAAHNDLPACDRMTLLLFLKFTFSFGQWTTILTLLNGGCVYLEPKFEPSRVLECIRRRYYDWCLMVPTMFRMLAIYLEAHCQRGFELRNDLNAGLRYWICGGEPLTKALGHKILNIFPDTGIYDVYGLTETNSADFIMRASEYLAHAGSIGLPSSGVSFRIMKKNGKCAAMSEVGEIELASCYRMAGYLKNPEATAAVMHGDFLKTGDLGWLDESGRVRLAGRAKEQICVAGVEISPLEIEDVFLQHPGVHACLATGLDDEITGQRIGLLIVPRDQMVLEVSELKAWAAERLDTFKVPKHILIGTDIPRGDTGKSDRTKLAHILSETSLANL